MGLGMELACKASVFPTVLSLAPAMFCGDVPLENRGVMVFSREGPDPSGAGVKEGWLAGAARNWLTRTLVLSH